MNAQEALVRTEELISSFELSEQEHRALSIVLETAKIFHSGEPQEGPYHYYFDGWHVRKDKLNEIGVLLEGQTNLFNEEVEE